MSDRRDMHSVTVRIAGEEHVIRANAEPEYTLSCAQLVDERIQEIRNAAGLIEGHKAAILAALSITDEFFQAREELDRLREDLIGAVDGAAERLEKGLAGGD